MADFISIPSNTNVNAHETHRINLFDELIEKRDLSPAFKFVENNKNKFKDTNNNSIG